MGEGVFIGPESSGCPTKVAYVRYLFTAVQRLSRTSRYYPEGIPKSSGHPVLMAYVRYLSTAVQRLFCTIRYYTVDSVNSAAYVRPKVAYVHCTVHRVLMYFLSDRTSGGAPLYVRTKGQQRTSTNPSIRPVQKSNSLKFPSSGS
jgi:hypothetical protein